MHLKAHPACKRDLINCQSILQTLLHAELRHPNGKTNNTTIFLSWAIEQFLTLVWVYSVELLLCTFYHKISILSVALPSSGHWYISLTCINMIAKPKQSQQNWMSTQFVALHGEIPPVVCVDIVNHCSCLHVRPACLHLVLLLVIVHQYTDSGCKDQ